MASYKTTVQPVAEPVSLAELKQHLRLYQDTTDDDAYVASLGVAARESIEARLNQTFSTTRTIVATLDGFPSDPGRRVWNYSCVYPFAGRLPDPGVDAVKLGYAPVLEVLSITYVDADGVSQTLDPSEYIVQPACSKVFPAPGKSWPSTSGQPGSVAITYTAGYADASEIPERARLIIKVLTAHWFNIRQPVNVGNTVNPIPFLIDSLCASLNAGDY